MGGLQVHLPDAEGLDESRREGFEGGLLSARWMRRACRPPTAVEPAHAQLSAAYSGCNVLLLCVLLAGALGEEE